MSEPSRTASDVRPAGSARTSLRIVRYHPRAVVGDGGMTTAIRRHAEEVAAMGGKVTIAFDHGETPSVSEGVAWRQIRHRGAAALRVAVGLDEALANADLLVLHSAWSPHNLRAASVARRSGIPYILEPRGAYDPHILRRKALVKKLWWGLGEKRMVEESRAVHVFFDQERAHLDALGYRGAVIVSPNGIDAPSGVHWDGGSGDYILWLGRFDPEHKGLDLLVDAIGELSPHERPRLRLHGPDRRGGKRAIAERVRKRGLSAWIQLGTAVYGDQKWSVMSQATGFVYPSRWEGFGIALAEAASIGLPSVVTPYPFGRSLVTEGAAIAAEATPESLAQGLLALGSPAARKTGDAAADVVRRLYSWEAVASSWIRQVEELL